MWNAWLQVLHTLLLEAGPKLSQSAVMVAGWGSLVRSPFFHHSPVHRKTLSPRRCKQAPTSPVCLPPTPRLPLAVELDREEGRWQCGSSGDHEADIRNYLRRHRHSKTQTGALPEELCGRPPVDYCLTPGNEEAAEKGENENMKCLTLCNTSVALGLLETHTTVTMGTASVDILTQKPAERNLKAVSVVAARKITRTLNSCPSRGNVT